MTFRQFALNNVKRSFGRYAAYFFSSTFAVTVFFMYAAFIFHPDVVNGSIRPSVRKGMVSAEVIIFLFATFFIFYSTSSFLKLRKKEFGLLTLLGITRSQLNKLIILENTIIAILAIVTGTAFGALFTKVFLMMFSVILDLQSPLSYYIDWKAIAITASVFLTIFEIITVMTLTTIRSKRVIDLLKAAKQPKKPPFYSIWLSILATVCLIIGYYLAYSSNIIQMTKRVIPILCLVVIGTYFLYTQASIGLLRFYKKRKRSYYRGTNLVTAAELIYKLKDNARILSMVTILTAVTFTSTGVLANLYFGKKAEAEARLPHAIALVSKTGSKDLFEETLYMLKSILKAEHIRFAGHQATFICVYNPDQPNNYVMQNLLLMSVTDYNKFADLAGQPHVSLPANTATFMHPTPDQGYEPIQGKQITLSIKNSNKIVTLKLNKPIKQPVINPSGYLGYTLVVPDPLFQELSHFATQETTQYYFGASYKNWESKTSVIEKLNDSIKKNKNIDYNISNNRLEFFNLMKETFSLMLFIGFFVSILFFLAADSILYFKLYNDLEQDIKQYHSLAKLGLTMKEMKQIAAKQVAILFFIPFAIATIHAGFAFKMLQNMVSGSVVKTSVLVIVIFLAVQLVYYFFIRSLYIKKIAKVM
ncbi:FtsX-like permease family protein [Thermaerobacillus caldiproteolyticus]|uniref:FtsX-like permease family protein n=1 Tax=Thermaerobacillus caldiproteolyticus TaxID=247480 RepID=UPI00188A5D5A|nr:ABC transporter permease [Anoxybacillus caldiproteolyticus]QPA31401.1 ABC transporter permease [Anoxybacillus caldiproteolyticus]